SIVLATQRAIEVGQVDRRRRKSWVKAPRRLVFGFSLSQLSPLHQKIRQRYTRLRSIRIEALRRHKFSSGAIESRPISLGLAGRWDRRKHRDGPDAHTLDRIRQQWCNKRPQLVGWDASQHVESGHAHHRVAVSEALLSQRDAGGREIGAKIDQRAGASDGWHIAVRGNLTEQFFGIGLLRPRSMEGRRISLESFTLWPEPRFDSVRRPLSRLVAMTIVARIWRAEPHRPIRAGNPETMVVPTIDDHICALRHVTRRARKRATRLFVVAMRGVFVFRGSVALQADAITGRTQSGAVRIVAIAARHARCEHLALLERKVVVELLDIAHLTVGVGKIAKHRRWQMCVRQCLPGNPFVRELCAPRVT